ncbi:UNVERIFIED_CONTAM: hypothetical protein K2H54_042563 [Gekko kuhli]
MANKENGIGSYGSLSKYPGRQHGGLTAGPQQEQLHPGQHSPGIPLDAENHHQQRKEQPEVFFQPEHG